MEKLLDSVKGRAMFKYIPKPNGKDPINFLKRKDQVIIFRLRTTHIQLNAHLSRITKDHPPACTLCGYREETVNHFLFDCPNLQSTRNEFLPQNRSKPYYLALQSSLAGSVRRLMGVFYSLRLFNRHSCFHHKYVFRNLFL